MLLSALLGTALAIEPVASTSMGISGWESGLRLENKAGAKHTLYSQPESLLFGDVYAQGQVLLQVLPVCSVENNRRRILLAAIHFWFRGPLPSLDMPSPFFRCCGARGPYLWTIGSDGICISTSTLQQVIYRITFHSSVCSSNL